MVMADDEEKRHRKKKEEERKKQEQKRIQELRLKRRMRSLHDKHRERRKKDCILGMPFIMAFQGDPAGLFYCNDIPDTFELIPRTGNYKGNTPLERLKTYIRHHVVQIAKKVLIYKAS